jgi:hypothetical protein
MGARLEIYIMYNTRKESWRSTEGGYHAALRVQYPALVAAAALAFAAAFSFSFTISW